MSERRLEPFIEGNAKDGFRIGARNPESDYTGPVAEVRADETWLWIITGEYEGVAMLNIEALPLLRRALDYLEEQLSQSEALPESPQ